MIHTARLILAALALGAAVAGCGSDAPAPPDLSKFVGSWSVVTGALTISCSDHGVQAIAVTEPTTLALGTSSFRRTPSYLRNSHSGMTFRSEKS